MGHHVKGSAEAQADDIHSSSLDTDAVAPLQKAARLVRHNLPLAKPHWLSLITSLSSICFDMSSRRICSMILSKNLTVDNQALHQDEEVT